MSSILNTIAILRAGLQAAAARESVLTAIGTALRFPSTNATTSDLVTAAASVAEAVATLTSVPQELTPAAQATAVGLLSTVIQVSGPALPTSPVTVTAILGAFSNVAHSAQLGVPAATTNTSGAQWGGSVRPPGPMAARTADSRASAASQDPPL